MADDAEAQNTERNPPAIQVMWHSPMQEQLNYVLLEYSGLSWELGKKKQKSSQSLGYNNKKYIRQQLKFRKEVLPSSSE